MSVEFAIVGSAVIVMFFSLMIVAGRILQQENDVRSAAQAAARAASLRDNAADAQAVATAVVNENLEQTGVSCDGGATVTLTSIPAHEPGALVRVEVLCTARTLASLGLPSVPYNYRATEIIDVFRGTP